MPQTLATPGEGGKEEMGDELCLAQKGDGCLLSAPVSPAWSVRFVSDSLRLLGSLSADATDGPVQCCEGRHGITFEHFKKGVPS